MKFDNSLISFSFLFLQIFILFTICNCSLINTDENVSSIISHDSDKSQSHTIEIDTKDNKKSQSDSSTDSDIETCKWDSDSDNEKFVLVPKIGDYDISFYNEDDDDEISIYKMKRQNKEDAIKMLAILGMSMGLLIRLMEKL